MKSKEIKQMIQRLDAILDTYVSNSEYDEITEKIKSLYQLLAIAEKEEQFLSVKEIKPTEWESNFLDSFLPGTMVITTKQYQVLHKISKNNKFRVGHTIYEFSANTKFGHLVITKF